jgi:hypothetical protein
VSGRGGKAARWFRHKAVIYYVLSPSLAELSRLATTSQLSFGVVALSDHWYILVGRLQVLAGAEVECVSYLYCLLLVVYCDWTNHWEGRKLKPLEHSLFLMR